MIELLDVFPEPDLLLALEPEELGAKLLFLVRDRKKNAGKHLGSFTFAEFEEEIWIHTDPAERLLYSDERRHDISMALREAWAWLEGQGLIFPDVGTEHSGSRRLSRRARKFESEADFANYAAARHLPREAIHRSIAGPVWAAFMRGDFDVAVFLALKAVEVSVREAGGYKSTDIGTDLMRKAFAVGKGPLTDKSRPDAEQQATSDMFAGAIGSFKNPQSHRNVSLENPAEAAEIVMFASYVLRVVDGVMAS